VEPSLSTTATNHQGKERKKQQRVFPSSVLVGTSERTDENRRATYSVRRCGAAFDDSVFVP